MPTVRDKETGVDRPVGGWDGDAALKGGVNSRLDGVKRPPFSGYRDMCSATTAIHMFCPFCLRSQWIIEVKKRCKPRTSFVRMEPSKIKGV